MVLLFTATSLLTAALLFLVQPMVARMVLPAFGGSQHVWTTAMLFFQVSLLLGYGYTHFATVRLRPRIQMATHLAVLCLPFFFLPIGMEVVSGDRVGSSPSLTLLAALTAGVAVPFIVVATSGPLLQRWFSWTDHPGAKDPYFLYAAGNVGSLGGLLAYPIAVERFFTLDEQSRVWALAYGSACVLVCMCALVVWRRAPAVTRPATSEPLRGTRISARRVAGWLFFAFLPSSLMLGVTSHLSTDVAAVPFLWVLPLAAYLLSFSVAFSRYNRAVLGATAALAPAIIVAAATLRPSTFGTPIAIVMQVALVLVGGLIAHGRLSDDRPDPASLTLFFLVVATGGALGGVFNGLVAPVLFPTVFEYALATIATLAVVTHWRQLVVGAKKWRRLTRLTVGLALAGLPVALFLLSALDALPASSLLRWGVVVALLLPLVTPFGRSGAIGLSTAVVVMAPLIAKVADSEHIERTFFGVHRVTREGSVLRLTHGNTVHGMQDTTSLESRREPTSYYHPDGPLGDVMRLPREGGPIAAIGLGAGSVAAYGQPGDLLTFYEIDPAVERIAREHFSYLSDSQARVIVEIGDGRLTISDARRGFALILLDAFSSDAIPVHLLTVEAFETYAAMLTDNGLIVANVSNRYLDLLPVIAAVADHLGLRALYRGDEGAGTAALPSRWVVLSPDPETIRPLTRHGWEELPPRRELWTDQRSSVWAVLSR